MGMIIKINREHYNEDYFFTLPYLVDWDDAAKELPIVQWLCQHLGYFEMCVGMSTYGQHWALYDNIEYAYVKFDGRKMRNMYRTEFILRFS